MKSTYFLLTFVILGYSAATNLQYNGGIKNLERIYENEMNETLECVRNILITGVPINIPSFAPLYIEDATIHFPILEIPNSMGKIDFKRMYINGITKWILNNLEIKFNDGIGMGATILAEINFPTLSTSADYHGDIVVNNNKLWGTGRFTMELRNLLFQVDTKLLSTKPISLEYINLVPTLEHFNISMYGLYHNDTANDIVVQMFNDGAVDWVNKNSENIGAYLRRLIKEYVDNAAQNGLQQKINIILHHCPLPFVNIF